MATDSPHRGRRITRQNGFNNCLILTEATLLEIASKRNEVNTEQCHVDRRNHPGKLGVTRYVEHNRCEIRPRLDIGSKVSASLVIQKLPRGLLVLATIVSFIDAFCGKPRRRAQQCFYDHQRILRLLDGERPNIGSPIEGMHKQTFCRQPPKRLPDRSTAYTAAFRDVRLDQPLTGGVLASIESLQNVFVNEVRRTGGLSFLALRSAAATFRRSGRVLAT